MQKCDELMELLRNIIINSNDIEKMSYSLKFGVEKLTISFIECSTYQFFNYFEKGFYLLKIYDRNYNLLLKKDFKYFSDLYNIVKEI